MSKPVANKDLGQHYLKDQKAIETICNDYAQDCDVIVEVGPGPVSLTKTLAKNEKPLYVIEKDTRFEDLLKNCVDTDKTFFEDALEFDWKKFITVNQLQDKKIWLVSNLPYNISVPLLLSFVKVQNIEFMTLMFQKEVGDKTYYRPDEKNQMSSLLAICLNYFTCSRLLKVAPGAFHPPPKVNSVVVSYHRKALPEVELPEFLKFEEFLRKVYQFKRKQLGGILKDIVSADQLEQMIELAGGDRRIRAENLQFPQLIALYKFHSSLSNDN